METVGNPFSTLQSVTSEHVALSATCAMLRLRRNLASLICSPDVYKRQDVLGMKIVSENYREGRDSWKADCFLGDTYAIEPGSYTHLYSNASPCRST